MGVREQEGQDCCSTQLIDENGVFNVEGLENFMRDTKMSERGADYASVAILGPQSSGTLVFSRLLRSFSFAFWSLNQGRLKNNYYYNIK